MGRASRDPFSSTIKHHGAMPIGRLASIAIDCDDPQELARFWIGMIGGEIYMENRHFVALRTERGWMALVRVPGYQPPSWPDGDIPKQMHLDVGVHDLDEAEAAAIDLGAKRLEKQPTPREWRVMLDPAGHPFCLTINIPEWTAA